MPPEEAPDESLTPTQDEELVLARMGDRFTAYSLDILIIVAGYYATFFLLFFNSGIGQHPSFAVLLLLLWIGISILYNGWFSSEGRQTLGKRFLGLRVLSRDGTPVSPRQGFIRAAGYLLSGVPFNLGFIWAFFQPEKRSWHDLMAGTIVVEDAPKSPGARTMSNLAALGFACLFVASWLWVFLGAPNFARMQIVANAQTALQALGILQEKYRLDTGAYASDLSTLLRHSNNEENFMGELPKIIDVASLSLQVTADSYLLEATAVDDRKTRVSLQGPLVPVEPQGVSSPQP